MHIYLVKDMNKVFYTRKMVPSPPCDKIVNLKIFYNLFLHNYVLRHSIKTWWKIIIIKNNFFQNLVPFSKNSANLVQKHKQYCHWLDILCVAFNKRFLSLSYKKKSQQSSPLFFNVTSAAANQILSFFLLQRRSQDGPFSKYFRFSLL